MFAKTAIRCVTIGRVFAVRTMCSTKKPDWLQAAKIAKPTSCEVSVFIPHELRETKTENCEKKIMPTIREIIDCIGGTDSENFRDAKMIEGNIECRFVKTPGYMILGFDYKSRPEWVNWIVQKKGIPIVGHWALKYD